MNKGISSFGEGKLRTYFIGFGLSIILTVIPFALVMNNVITRSGIIKTIVAFAIVQVIVHIICFLKLRPTADQTWNWLAFTYTLILLGALVVGSAWIIYHLNLNMVMP